MTRLRLIALCLTLLALSPLKAFADTCGGPYKFGFYRQGVMYYDDAQGRPTGFDKDLVDELERRSGCAFERVVESRPRIWDQMRRGQLHLTASANPTSEREVFAEFVPYAQGRYWVTMRRELAQRVSTRHAFDADPTLRLAVVKTYAHGPATDGWVNELRQQGRVTETGDFATAVRLLQVRRADAILVVPPTLGQVMAAFESPEAIAMFDWMPSDRSLASLAMQRHAMPLNDRLRLCEAMQTMIRDGTVDALLRRHLGDKGARLARYTPGG
jgi:polar amino acid transport system substrate-binding protein